MNEIRRFTETDWSCYGGAERFNNTGAPFIYEKEFNEGKADMIIIADRNGLEINLRSEEVDATDVWILGKENFSPLRALGMMRAITKALEEYTEISDISYELDHPHKEELKEFTYNGQY